MKNTALVRLALSHALIIYNILSPLDAVLRPQSQRDGLELAPVALSILLFVREAARKLTISACHTTRPRPAKTNFLFDLAVLCTSCSFLSSCCNFAENGDHIAQTQPPETDHNKQNIEHYLHSHSCCWTMRHASPAAQLACMPFHLVPRLERFEVREGQSEDRCKTPLALVYKWSFQGGQTDVKATMDAVPLSDGLHSVIVLFGSQTVPALALLQWRAIC